MIYNQEILKGWLKKIPNHGYCFLLSLRTLEMFQEGQGKKKKKREAGVGGSANISPLLFFQVICVTQVIEALSA